MKHLIRKLLILVLVLATASILATTASAASGDTMTLNTLPESGAVTLSPYGNTSFIIRPTVTSRAGENVTDEYTFTYNWTLKGITVSSTYNYEFPAEKNESFSTLNCIVTAIHKTDGNTLTQQVSWTTYVQGKQDISLRINESIGNYYFDSTATSTGTSIYSEIVKLLSEDPDVDRSSCRINFEPITFSYAFYKGPTTCALNEIGDIYLSVSSSGTWRTRYTVTQDSRTVLSGTITVTIDPHIGIDAIFSAAPGKNIVVSADDFEEFWIKSAGANASMDYLYISSCTGLAGALCYQHKTTEQSHTSAYNLKMYTDPSSLRKELGDLTFIPNKTNDKYAPGVVTLKLIAVGKDENGSPISIKGSFTLLYTTKDAAPISYSCTGTHAALSASDFDAVYRSVTGNAAKTDSYNIQFLDVPKYGILYRNYSLNSFGVHTGTPLTEENKSRLVFSNNVSGENSLNNLAYLPTNYIPTGETIRYVAYSGTTILYTGTVTFSSRELIVTYTTCASNPVSFSGSDFYSANSPLVGSPFIVFGNPSSGTLYKDYAKGVRVMSNDYFSHTATGITKSLDSVTYVPKDGFTGTVNIPFAAQSPNGGSISGKVRIYVVANVFDDVESGSWAAPFINRLYSLGVINGTTATTFAPDDTITYGAALKMILRAVGYPKQHEPAGSEWAINYLELAYKNGIVSTKDVDMLNKPVSRTTVAEIAAKAMGFKEAAKVNSGIAAPVDTTNGYVYALYNAGIINGITENDRNYFKGDDDFTRAQVAKLVCTILDYIQ